ncbi:MAG: hypothetical protein ACPHL8_03415 [Flavobacteriales bacterium]
MKILNLFSFLLVSVVLFINPIFKYFENVFGFLRVNISSLYLIILSIILIIYFIFFNIKNNRFLFKNNFDNKFVFFIGLVFSILIYVTFISILYFPFKFDLVGIKNYLIRFSDSILKYWVFSIIGFTLLDVFYDKLKKNIIKFYWIILTLVYLYFTFTNQYGFFIRLDGKAIYILLADSYMMLSILVISFQKNILYKSLILLTSIIVLFILKSRAALFVFVLVYLIIFLLRYRGALILFSCLLVSTLIYYDLINLILENSSNRMFRFFISGQDSSLSTRSVIFNEEINKIKYNFGWILGDYLGDYEFNKGSMGRYIHNYFSFLRQFGVFPFLLFSVSIIYLYLKSSVNYIRNRNKKVLEFIFVYTTVYLIQIIVARSFLSAYIWVSLTLIPIYFYSSKYFKNDININAS